MNQFLLRFLRDRLKKSVFGHGLTPWTTARRRRGTHNVPAWVHLEPREMLTAVATAIDIADLDDCPVWEEESHTHGEIAPALTAENASFPLGSTFQLSSRPFATKTIYLDFNGHVTTNTQWNSDYGKSSIVSPAYDFEGGAAVFTDSELTRIQSIWQAVAEKYSPFEVNVTTQEPPLNDLVNNGGGDNRWGMRVVLGGTSQTVLSPQTNVGGVAKLSSFSWGSDTPCFVFNGISSANDKVTADTAAHEVGHTLGLWHDGLMPANPNSNDPGAYYSGHGTGATSWAPIMGGPNSKQVVQWSAGAYPNANNREDDLAIITSNTNGFGFRADDHAAFAAQSTPLIVTSNAFFGRGVIEQPSDWDFFRVDVSGPTVVTIDPAERGGMLDIGVQLFDANLNIIGNYDNYDQLNAILTFGNTPATYYLRVFGVGKPSFGMSDEYGYPSYGSLGQYTIRGTVYSNDPDDQLSEARPITTSTSLIDSLDYSNDVDMYRFTAVAGERVTFDFDRPGGTNDLDLAALRLFDSNGALLAFSVTDYNPDEPNLPGGNEAYLDWNFGESTTYYLGVSGYPNLNYNPITGEGDTGGYFGPYQITLTSYGVQPDTDPDDQIAEAVAFPESGTVVGSLMPNGDVDMFVVQAAENERLLIDVDQIVGSTGFRLSDSYLRVFNSSGQQVAFNDDGLDAGEDMSLDSYLDFTVPATGTYYIGISGANPNYNPVNGFGDVPGSAGDYRLQVTRVAPPNHPPVVSDQFCFVDENTPPGTAVWTFAATDPDVGQKLTYVLFDGNEDGAFAIDPETGVITVANSDPLNAEFRSEFVLTVVVIDDGFNPLPFSAAGKMTIRLRDINDAPQFAPNGFSIPENSPLDAAVGIVNVTDEDVGQTLTYAIVGGNPNNAFAIDSTTGLITVANPTALDYEAGPRSPLLPDFSLMVSATDNGSPSLTTTASVYIGLSDVNEAPRVVAKDCLIGENSVTNAFIATITASDPDGGQTLEFAITGGNVNNAFKIDPHTGVFSVNNAAALDFETTQQFNLTVSVTDNAVPALSSSAAVRVFLRDVNEFNPVVQARDFLIGENSANNAFIGTIAATDGDTAQIRTFAITAGNTGNAFRIHPDTGVLSVNNTTALDFETTSQFNLTITVTDNGTPAKSGSATTRVFLRDVNEFNPAVQARDFLIGENSANNAFIGTIASTDGDTAQSRTFAITGGNTGSAFRIHPETGVLSVNNTTAIDFESASQFNLTITVTDNGSPARSGSATTRVFLRDVNEAPVVAAKDFLIGENSINGAYIGSIAATDPDAGQTRLYAISSGNTDNAFAINPFTGVLTVKNAAALDFEKTRQFDLVVTATDNGSPAQTGAAPVRVFLRDVNEAPIVLPQSFAVQTRAAAGTLVGSVRATDPDAGQTLSFTIESGNGLFNNIFKIDSGTGRITVNNSLSLLFAGQYTLNVRVRDSATPSLSTLASIRIFVNSTGTVPGIWDPSSDQVDLPADVKLNKTPLALMKASRTVTKLFGR